MPHRIDIDGIRKEIFILKNLAFASQPFCRTYHVDRCQEDEDRFGWQYYIGWLKASVSEILIEVAIKMRVLEDFLKQDESVSIDFTDLENKALAGLVIGRFQPSRAVIPLRKCCNKIIHAVEVSLVWIKTDDGEGGYEYWTGDVSLEGTHGKDDWECVIYVIEFCETIESLLSLLDNQVDWYHVYKYDD